jgi:phage-related protein
MTKPLAEIAWEGDSKEVLSVFPSEVKSTFGFSLRRLQNGELPRCGVRSMASVGKGVWELKTDDARTWYRVMYLSQVQGSFTCSTPLRKTARRQTDGTLKPPKSG